MSRIANAEDQTSGVRAGRQAMRAIQVWIKRYRPARVSPQGEALNRGAALLQCVLAAESEDDLLHLLHFSQGMGLALGSMLVQVSPQMRADFLAALKGGIAAGADWVEATLEPVGHA